MKDRITLFFEPEDVLLFRDHRPFDMGQHVLARSTFPQPTVFRGAVRTALFRQMGADFYTRKHEFFGLEQVWCQKVLGGRECPGSLTLHGPLLARRVEGTVEPLFRLPFDLVRCVAPEKDDSNAGVNHKWTILSPIDFADIDADDQPKRWHRTPRQTDLIQIDDALPWTNEELSKAGRGHLLTLHGARAYLAGDIEHLETVAEESVYQTEVRVGIGRNADTRTVEEGLFYITLCYRFAPGCGFAVEMDLRESCTAATGTTTDTEQRPDQQRPGAYRSELESALQRLEGNLVQLGGKGHFASIGVVDAPLFPELAQQQRPPGGADRTKLWLQTPALIDLNEESDQIDLWHGGRLVAKVTDRPVLVGGFDIANRRERELRRALPAGTVLWLEGITPEAATATLIERQNPNDSRVGYGAALAGRWTTNELER